ncbi:SAM-dependent methyltransferase [Bailinhaonella thermotolerans]|uniref:SAM-dependent methyltransferase n=1 Tax=Bailinhaonella thermotolerans TaxID=1070861 RepID=A0A3A4APD0_9ACTN|nr:SAM-dependent methyltransferase [Bailinhaonella thermotolerans]RJL21125.1 SAM-dependent methyltransferase [Bailinhaonella thermotolerans]
MEKVPPGVNPTVPNVARVYDYWLDGKNNYAVDRAIVEASNKVLPDAPQMARANREFLGRVVRYLAQSGIRQFFDLGSGLPTEQNVHQVAQAIAPEARVVYVDYDPVVLAHGRALLADNGSTRIVTADVRRPEEVVHHPDVAGFIDFRRPVALLMFGILHHFNDNERPHDVAAYLRTELAPGSYLAMSNFHTPGPDMPEVHAKLSEMERIGQEQVGSVRFRTRDELMAYFGDFELLDPGLVPLPEWRPDGTETAQMADGYHGILGGVARKPW